MKIAHIPSRFILALLLFSTQWAQAIPINYELVDLGSGRYQYNYTITNELTQPLDGFAIYFAPSLYDNLVLESSPADWDSIVYQTDPTFGFEGALESLALGSPLLSGQSASEFSVSFDWLGGTIFGNQDFEFFDSLTFDTQFTGLTEPKQTANSVPTPASLALLIIGLAAIRSIHRKF